MAKKRKAHGPSSSKEQSRSAKFDINETFDDSEDEFYNGQDEILLEHHSTKRQRRMLEQERNLQPSDEEILGYDEENEVESDENDYVDGNAGDEEEQEENWGSNRADYYNADIIETEADALEEEAEAKRLHQKQMKGMTEADFGFDEATWTDTKTPVSGKRSMVEKLPETQIPEKTTEDEKLNILRNRYPEFEPLARDFANLLPTQKDLERKAQEIQTAIQNGATLGVGITAQTKLHALSTYLGTIAIYFAVLSSQIKSDPSSRQITSISPAELRDHAVIEKLAKSRRLWDMVKNHKVAETRLIKQPPEKVAAAIHQDDISQHERLPEVIEPKKTIKSKKHGPEAGNGTEKEKVERPKYNDLHTLLLNSALPEEDSDFGDENPLTEDQAAEKAKKRKSLRFYTSQIAQKANKRGIASRVAGGDDDLPYKERDRDRQERLLKEAQARGKAVPDNEEELEDDNEVDEVPNEYYDSLVANSKKKKADKKARAEAYAEAVRLGAEVYEEDVVGEDGKRAITYAIQKNKGLTPKRKKEVRNPRVKKKKQFDKKMKKLGSIRPVYKGGEGRGGYGGELTGIKTNVVRGIKL